MLSIRPVASCAVPLLSRYESSGSAAAFGRAMPVLSDLRDFRRLSTLDRAVRPLIPRLVYCECVRRDLLALDRGNHQLATHPFKKKEKDSVQ